MAWTVAGGKEIWVGHHYYYSSLGDEEIEVQGGEVNDSDLRVLRGWS